ncbi:hypothetical protein F5887DRAFT_225756 [Amanita rubescens]|jgi:hypothetical protein|nr:hypothetical protein F5887DRAFT_225756 [Amanita rubescens]
MLAPISDSASDFIFQNHLYYKQPLQIIQLVECPAPPPRPSPAYAYSSDAPSSSDYLESDEDSDEICSSYCSSDVPPDHADSALDSHPQASPSFSPSPETYDSRMKRILAWRENFSPAISGAFSDPENNPLKRKFDDEGDEDDDSMSHSSKRSRSSDAGTSISSLGEHSCPACDATFSTRQSLRQHGLDAAKENEACSIAVEYAFE